MNICRSGVFVEEFGVPSAIGVEQIRDFLEPASPFRRDGSERGPPRDPGVPPQTDFAAVADTPDHVSFNKFETNAQSHTTLPRHFP